MTDKDSYSRYLAGPPLQAQPLAAPLTQEPDALWRIASALGAIQQQMQSFDAQIGAIGRRLTRVESRLVQFMTDMDCDPHAHNGGRDARDA